MCPNQAKCSQDAPESIQRTLAIIGDKWSALILRQLHASPLRFCEIEERLSGISPRTLSQRLEMLGAEGIITKEPGTRGNYSLTPKGTDLDDVIHQMAKWGEKYGAQGCGPAAAV